ncbi:MAG TPA: MMPL family transporter [Burkholderiaceae bacterium]
MTSFERFSRNYLRFITNHPKIVMALVLLITCFFGFAARNMKVINNNDLWLPHGDAYVETTESIEQIFGGKNVVVIGIKPTQGDVYQPAVLAKVKRLQESMLRIPEAIRDNVVSLAARKAKGIHGTADGMEVRALLETIPQNAEQLAKLKKSIAENPFYIGALVSPDGKFAAVIADFRMKKDAEGFTALNNEINAAVDAERDATATLYVAGSPVSFAGIEHYTQSSGAYFGVAFLIIMAVQFLSFRSIQGMLLPMLTALLSVAWGIGTLKLCGYDLDVLNTTTPILIMAITSGHAIQLLKRYYEEYRRLAEANTANAANGTARLTPHQLNKEAVVESLSKVGRVMLAAGLIASITFYSLTLGNIDMVRHFGIFAGSGVLSGLVLEMTFIPALRSMLPAPKLRPVETESAGMLGRILSVFSASVQGKRAAWVLCIGVALIGILGAGIPRLRVDDSTLLYFSPQHVIRTDDHAINQAFGGTNTVYFLVEGEQADSMKDPQVLIAMEKLQTFLAQQPEVGKTQSLADLVKRMNQAVHNDDPAFNVIPNDRELVAQYLFLYSLSGDPQDFDNYVDSDYRKMLGWAFVKSDSTAYFKDLVARAQPLIDKEFPRNVKVRVGGTLAEIAAINDAVIREKIVNTAQMALVILVLTSLMLRSVVGGLFVVVPVMIIVVANFGVMGWLGTPLDMGTASIASMAIGIGADYEIYLLLRFKEELARLKDARLASERALQTSGRAILYITLALVGGYAVLFASDFTFYSRLATAVIMTMTISALSAILFLRAMILVIKPRFLFGELAKAAPQPRTPARNAIVEEA